MDFMDLINMTISSINTTFESTFESVCETQSGNPESTHHSSDLIDKLMLLYLKHNLTLVCLEDVVKLLNDTLEECLKLPTGKVQILNMFRAHRDLVDILFFVKCNKCQKYTKTESRIGAACSRCPNGLKLTETNYFVYLPIEHQIVKSVKDNWSFIQKFVMDSSTEPSTISDVHDGSILRKIMDKYRSSDVNVLSLTINVDGANKFKSNSKSVWPIQLIQNYLPPNIRFLPHNIIVCGLQYVDSKDDDTDDLNFREFLLPLVNELNCFKKDNIEIEVDGDMYKYKPIITHSAVDLPAKSKLAEMKQFGGYDSCTFCEIRGELVEIPKLANPKKRGKDKATEVSNSETAKPKSAVRYVEGKPYKIRDEVETLQKMLLASASNCQNPIDGIKDVSCLVGLEHFNVVWGFSVEYMHLCLLGATKRFVNFLFKPMYSAKDYYIVPRRRLSFNKLLLSIKPTSAIARKPRSINQRANFKASEYRSWLLYYLPVVLPGYVPIAYVKHIRVLSATVYTLLKENISSQEIDNAEKMLEMFVKEHQELFGKVNMVTVIHLLKHMSESVRRLGPLWAHSAFPFERNNGRLLKWVNGTSDVIHQISSKYALSKAVIQHNPKPNSEVLLGKSVTIEETASHILSISSFEILNFSNINLIVHKRIRLKNVVYTSTMYTRPKRSIDYFIGLDSGHFGTAKYYFETNGQIYVMMNQFKTVDNVYHILKVVPTNRLIVAPVNEICKKYIFMKIGLYSYIVCQPNSYEKE